MRCPVCHSEWDIQNEKIYILCPFCQKPLIDLTADGKSLKDVLISFTSSYGKQGLADKQAVLQYINLRFPKSKREQNFLNIAYSAGLIKMLMLAEKRSADQQLSIVQQAISQMEDSYGVSSDWASYVISCVAASLEMDATIDNSFLELQAQADGGDLTAQMEIAFHYFEQEGAKDNYSFWITKAIQNGSIKAKCHYGKYKHGNGDEKERQEGISLLLDAAKAGNTDAICYLAHHINDCGTATDEVRNMVAGLVNSDLNISAGESYDLSYFSEHYGDIDEAISHIERAYAQDRPIAWNRYIQLLRIRGNPNDKVIVGKVLRELTADGNLDAVFMLGSELEKNASTHADMVSALYWLKLAGDSGKLDAQLRLASIYEQGYLVDKDIKKAVYWYELAASQGSSAAYDKISFKSKFCIRKEIDIVLDDGEELICPVFSIITRNDNDYLIVQEPESGDVLPLLYTELDNMGQYSVESLDDQEEEEIMELYRRTQ